MVSSRLQRSVVALAASAITAVYAAGYVRTQAADAALSTPDPSAPAATAPATSAPANAARPTVTTSNTTQAASATNGLKDGTFTGVGTSRRGDIQVSLIVQGGRVSTVNITGATTQYPTRFISKLPGEVVSRQSAQIDVVGGATYSSLAFRGAVQQALQHAHV